MKSILKIATLVLIFATCMSLKAQGLLLNVNQSFSFPAQIVTADYPAVFPSNFTPILVGAQVFSINSGGGPGGNQNYYTYSLINGSSVVSSTVNGDYVITGDPGYDIYFQILQRGGVTYGGVAANPVYAAYVGNGGGSIPEPSTYAAIFGVTVLGFAAYRRRKNSV